MPPTAAPATSTRRRPAAGDVVRVGVGVAVIAVGVAAGHLGRATVQGVELDLLRLTGRLPDAVEDLLIGAAQLLVRVLPAVVVVALLVRRRWKLVLALIATAWLANLAMAAAQWALFDRTLDELLALADERRAQGIAFAPSSEVVASITAVVTMTAPLVGRRWRRAMWSVVGTVVVLRLISPTDPAFDLVVALGVGVLVGSLVQLVRGSTVGPPSPEVVAEALRGVGLAPVAVEPRERAGTAHRYGVVDQDGRVLEVILRTPDEREADLLARAARRLRLVESEVDPGYARVDRRVEHEALALLLAERGGLPAARLVALGALADGAAFVVTTAPPERPVTVEDLAEPGRVDALWQRVRELHASGIAHRHLDLDALRLDPAGVLHLTDFDRARLTPVDRDRARDIAAMLVETAVALGPGPAVAAAADALGPDALAAALPVLQPLALPTDTRARAKGHAGLLDELRVAAAEAAGVEEVSLERLERIRPRTLVMVVASSLAFYSLLPQLANLGSTVESFTDADPLWLVGTVLASVASYVFAAVSFQGSVAQPLAFASNLRAQVGASFAGLVGPAGAGGYALTARFLQRNGLDAGEAAASVSINGVAGVAVHVLLTLGFVTWTSRSDTTGTSGLVGIELPAGSTILLVLAVLLAMIGGTLGIAPVRRRVVGPALAAVRSAGAQLAAVARRPARVAALVGGSAAISLSYVAAAAAAVAAFGGELSFAQVGTAYLAAAALASVAPTPGGLGAFEAALVALLTGFRMPDGPAVAAVLTFRLATFWLPILPGWAAVTWMQRRDEL